MLAVVRIHPGGFRLVLAGPKVARLLPFLQQKGFVAEAFSKGSEALNRMRQAPCHLLLLELECGDTMGIDLARGAKQEGITAAALLVDDPMKSGMIISALARGVDAYVAIPPDETIFFSRIENMLLAQWALVMTQQQNQLTEEVARLQKSVDDADAQKVAAERKLKERISDLEKQVATEKKRVADLDREAAVLREQLTTMHLVTGAKTGLSDEGAALRSDENDEQVDFLLDDEPVRPPPPKKAPSKATPPPPKASPPPSKAAPAPAPRPAPLDDDLEDFATIVKARPPAPQPPRDSMEESTQDIPASVAKGILDQLNTAPVPSPMAQARPQPTAPPTTAPTVARPAAKSATMPSMPAFADTGLDELAAFDPDKLPDIEEEPPEFTMAMPSAVARSLLAESSITHGNPLAEMPPPTKRPVVDDVRTAAVSADVARAAVAAAGPKKGPARGGDDELATLAMPKAADWSDHTDSEFDAPTAAVPIGTSIPPAKKRPPTVPRPIDDFDEPTPAAGFGKAAALPRSMGVSSGEGRGFDGARRGTKPAALDSQVVRDLAGIPSIDNEEVLFADDD